MDGQRPQPHRPHDARQRAARRTRCGCGGRACDDGATRSLQISGLPYGTESNPPALGSARRIVMAYDAGNAVLAAWRMDGDELAPLWRRERLAHAGHLIALPRHARARRTGLPATGSRRCGDPRLRRPLARGMALLARSRAARRASLRAGSDSVVVLDLDTGEEKARAAVPSPSQAFLFPAPGFGRDLYYQSITTIARLVWWRVAERRVRLPRSARCRGRAARRRRRRRCARRRSSRRDAASSRRKRRARRRRTRRRPSRRVRRRQLPAVAQAPERHVDRAADVPAAPLLALAHVDERHAALAQALGERVQVPRALAAMRVPATASAMPRIRHRPTACRARAIASASCHSPAAITIGSCGASAQPARVPSAGADTAGSARPRCGSAS